MKRFGIAIIAALAVLIVIATHHPAGAVEMTFLSAESLEGALHDLIPEFERSTGHRVHVAFANLGTTAERVRKGDAADLATVSPQQWESLRQEGKLNPAVRAVVSKVGVGVFVKKGARRPDIGSVESFRKSVLDARTIALRDPAQRSPVGATVMALFERLGLADAVKAKLQLTADRPYRAVIDGDAEIGFSTLVEIKASPEVDLVGPLPADLQRFITQVAAIPTNAKEPAAAMTLIEFLRSPHAASVLKTKGFDLDR
jgi:molybdate transport system substrate-binding protein